MASTFNSMRKSERLEKEAAAFDKQALERIQNGFVPDLRRLKKVDWFYNNVWRDPEFAKIHWFPRIKNIIEHAKKSGSKVLEVGCGLGMLSLEFARHGLEVTGVDLSPKSIEIAKHYKEANPFKGNFGSLRYICADFKEIEFEKEYFDSVVFFRTFHHIPDPERTVQKVSSILALGGKIILSEPVRAHFTMESALLAGILRIILPTWIPYSEKLKRDWNEGDWNQEIHDIFEEYVIKGKYEQSPMDNTTNSSEEIVKSIKKHFMIIEENYYDAFVDKIIGGLRGEYKYELANFLSFLDKYIIENGFLPPTSLELVGTKKG